MRCAELFAPRKVLTTTPVSPAEARYYGVEAVCFGPAPCVVFQKASPGTHQTSVWCVFKSTPLLHTSAHTRLMWNAEINEQQQGTFFGDGGL